MACAIDRLEARENRRIAAFAVQESADAFDPVVGADVGKVNPEDVMEDGVVRCADHVHVVHPQQLLAQQAARDVHVASAVGVQTERKEGQPDMVGRDRGHGSPLEAGRQESVDQGIA